MGRECISLDGIWEFTEKDKDDWQSGTVPGCVQLDLIALGKLKDPFYRIEEYNAYSVAEKEWIYRKEFIFTKKEYNKAELVFEGLDTLATIYLNGHYIGKAENMFIPHRFDVGNYLKEGKNLIEVHFASAILKGAALRKAYTHPPVGDGRIFLRKAQYSFGWDWNPYLVQVGIWRSVYIELSGPAKLAHPYFLTREITDNKATVEVSAEIILSQLEKEFKIEDLSVTLTIKEEENGNIVDKKELKLVKQQEGWGIKDTLQITNPKLWYPNGYGEQPLYQVEMVLNQTKDNQMREIDRISFITGIRTVKLLREKDAEGESFIFIINGVKVFAKGADWVPADTFLPRIKKDDYEKYVRLAKEANMNMLRIWGGGIYEDPVFYSACDRYGIMIWQDFMYACAQYPDHTSWFREIAERESITVIKTLRNHPSIVLWCGNNENNWGFYAWWGVDDPEYLGNYIYKQILPKLCATLDPSRPYWVSSPFGGKDPNSEKEGDRHSWDIWSGWKDYSNYNFDYGRFLSEFGFQSMPTWPTVLQFTAPEDRKINSFIVRSHNKQQEGMERLLRFLYGRIGIPKDFKSFVYLTQFNQAEAIKTGVEHWRTRKFATSGTLYWQFNDSWPSATWSCLDYYKRKKALYYYSKHLYDNLLIVLKPLIVNNQEISWFKNQVQGLEVILVNDNLEAKKGQFRIACYTLKGVKKGEIKKDIEIPADSTFYLGKFTSKDLGLGYSPIPVSVPYGNSILVGEENKELLHSVIFAELITEDNVYRNYLVFQPFRDLPLCTPNIKTITKEKGIIELKSDIPAFGVFLETEEDIDLEDNCLYLEPGIEYKIKYTGEIKKINVLDLTQFIQDI